MPIYTYYCPANQRTLEAVHGMEQEIRNWGELCYCCFEPIGDTDFLAPVEKRLSAAYISSPPDKEQLRESGFSKLVRRDKGIYENVTVEDGEPRIVQLGGKQSQET